MADCQNLATASDMAGIYDQLSTCCSKMDGLATKEDIAGIASTLAQINARLDRIEGNQTATEERIGAIANDQNSIMDRVGNIPNWLDGIIDRITGAFNSIVGRVWDGLQDIGSAIAAAANRLWDGIQWVGGKVVDMAQYVWDKVADAAQFIWDGVQWVGGKVVDMAQWVWNKVQDVGQWIWDGVQWVGGKIGDLTQWIGGKIGDLWEWISGGFGNIGRAIADKMQWLWDKMNDVSQFLWDAIRGVTGDIDNLGSSLASRFDGLWSELNAIRGAIFDTGRFIGDLSNKLTDWIAGLAGAIADKIWAAINWLWDQIRGGSNNNNDCCDDLRYRLDRIYSSLVRTGSGDESLAEKQENLAAELKKLTDWILGGVSNNTFSANFEDKLKGLIGDLFSPDLKTSTTEDINNLTDLIFAVSAVSYGRAGYQDYPISVPALPLNAESEPLEIVTASRFQSWQTKFIDNGIGMFPFEIKINDSDLVKVGNQPINIKFPNIAETLAEIFGFLVINKSLSEANTQIGVKSLGELGALRKQGYLSHKLLAATVSYLGFKTKQKKEKLDLSFNPLVGVDGTEDSFSEALKPKKVDIIVEVEDEDKSLEDKLALLLESASIIKAVNFEKLDENNAEELKDFYKGIKEEEDTDEEFDTFIEEFEQGFISRANLTDQLNPYGRSFTRRPRVKEIGDQADQTEG